MPQIGWLEILSIVIIAILVLGPKEFPIALKKIGSYIGKFKNTISNFQKEVTSVTKEVNLEEEIIVILKDSKGDPLKNKLITKIKLVVNDDQNNLISTKNFNEDFDYSVQDNKFNMKQYEQNIRQNLIEDISGQILSYLSNLQ